MGILKRFLDPSPVAMPDASALRRIWNDYSDQWPANNEKFSHWKPASILPAPKWIVKGAVKLGYAEWPEPIDWGVFSPFFMEFVDLANHLPEQEFSVIQRFRERRIHCAGKDHDLLLGFELLSPLAVSQSVRQCEEQIARVRDGLRRSAAWDPIGADNRELDAVRQILLRSTVEFAT